MKKTLFKLFNIPYSEEEENRGSAQEATNSPPQEKSRGASAGNAVHTHSDGGGEHQDLSQEYKRVYDDIILKNQVIEKAGELLSKVVVIQFVVIIGLVLLSLLLFFKTPDVKYFLADEFGHVYPINPVDQPYPDKKRLIGWVRHAVIDVTSWSFSDYKRHSREIRKYFSYKVYSDYLLKLKKIGFFSKIRREYYVVSSALNGAPVIVDEFKRDGAVYYKLQVPIVQTYNSAGRKLNVKGMVILTVKRVPLSESKSGLLITQFVLKN